MVRVTTPEEEDAKRHREREKLVRIENRMDARPGHTVFDAQGIRKRP
jgi:hypothetical protein